MNLTRSLERIAYAQEAIKLLRATPPGFSTHKDALDYKGKLEGAMFILRHHWGVFHHLTGYTPAVFMYNGKSLFPLMDLNTDKAIDESKYGKLMASRKAVLAIDPYKAEIEYELSKVIES